jgi:hypothetical protein
MFDISEQWLPKLSPDNVIFTPIYTQCFRSLVTSGKLGRENGYQGLLRNLGNSSSFAEIYISVPVALSTFVEEAPHGSVHKTPMTLSTGRIHPTAKYSYDIIPMTFADFKDGRKLGMKQ